MPRVETKLIPNQDGSWSARKRIPADVQEAYAKLYGMRWEVRFNSGPALPMVTVRAKHREWLTEIENRIANIRAERNGGGHTLTPREAHGLAGTWYQWFTDRYLAKPKSAEHWDEEAWEPYDLVRQVAWGDNHHAWPDKQVCDLHGISEFDGWEENPGRVHLRPLIADRAETAQFLHAQKLTLDPASRDMFLDCVCRNYFEALDLLKRRARGDYGPDKFAERFPAFERSTDPGLTPWMLFERWIGEAKPATSTVDRWRSVFLRLQTDFPTCAGIAPEAAQDWARGLVGEERSERTVNNTYLGAARTIFSWAKDVRVIGQNPFKDVRIKVPRKSLTRETKAFTTDEIKTILKAALAIEPTSKMKAAKRWLPWVCAYTGARGGEIAQLRGADCIQQDGVWALRITPEAGTVKTKQTRTVPIHEHLLAQGFLEFTKASGKGPLFYSERKTPPRATDPTNPPKPRYVKVRERIAEWVREVGVTDEEVQPNHAWRHTFKQVCDQHEISERVSDAITGHAPATVGRTYGAPTLIGKAEALKRFPRYEIGEENHRTSHGRRRSGG
jgi:integrase